MSHQLFNEEQLRAVVTKAIIEGLGEEQKTVILAKAIESLMARAHPNDYHDKRNVVEAAFQEEARRQVNVIAREELAKPEHQEKLRALFNEVVAKAFEGDGRTTLVSALSSAIGDAMGKVRY